MSDDKREEKSTTFLWQMNQAIGSELEIYRGWKERADRAENLAGEGKPYTLDLVAVAAMHESAARYNALQRRKDFDFPYVETSPLTENRTER